MILDPTSATLGLDIDLETANLLARQHGKQKARRFSAEPLTGFGDLNDDEHDPHPKGRWSKACPACRAELLSEGDGSPQFDAPAHEHGSYRGSL